MITQKESQLVQDFLKEYADRLGRDGCNDWRFPSDWTVLEKEEFVKRYHAWNGDPEEYDPKRLVLPNFAVVDFLAHKLTKKEVEYNIKIRSVLDAKENWLLGYLTADQQKDLVLSVEKSKGPFVINFNHSGTRMIIKVYDSANNCLVDLTDYT